MKIFLGKAVLFIAAFLIIVNAFPKSIIESQELNYPQNPEIQEAIENIKFYSDFNFQTMNQDRLNRTITDFYLPIKYENIEISYLIVSEYLEVSQDSQIISLRTGDIEVKKVTLIKSPSILRGNHAFTINATFSVGDESFLYHYYGYVNPIIPDSFLGGSLYTLVTYGTMFFQGALLTLLLALSGTIIGFFLALVVATAKMIQSDEFESTLKKLMKKTMNRAASLYITVFRGTPMIVQASFFWYGFGLFGNPLLCGLFVVSINTAAYIAEIIRGSIQAIDKGQTEAGYSVGLTYSQTMLFIIFPQAIKNSIPAIGNEFVINIKDTAVLSVIGIFELFNQTKKITGMHYRQLEAYAIVALIYLVLTLSTTNFLSFIERRMGMQPKELTSSS